MHVPYCWGSVQISSVGCFARRRRISTMLLSHSMAYRILMTVILIEIDQNSCKSLKFAGRVSTPLLHNTIELQLTQQYITSPLTLVITAGRERMFVIDDDTSYKTKNIPRTQTNAIPIWDTPPRRETVKFQILLIILFVMFELSREFHEQHGCFRNIPYRHTTSPIKTENMSCIQEVKFNIHEMLHIMPCACQTLPENYMKMCSYVCP